jgi:hypothetical protein
MEHKLGQIDAVMKLQANDSKKLERMNQLIMSMEGEHHSDQDSHGKRDSLTDKLRNKLKKVGSSRLLEDSADTPANMHTIEDKLDQLLKNAGSNPLASSSGAVYYDKGNPAQGDELVTVPKQKLSVQEKARIAFGTRLVEMVGLPPVTFTAVASLPPSTLSNNAFKNSYHYDDKTNELFMHIDRLSSSGDFGLVCIHALSHIKVNPMDLSNDNDPQFAAEFYTNLRILSQDLYKNINSTSNNGPSNSPKDRSPSITGADSVPVSTAEYFNKQRMHERMKQYLANEGGAGQVPTSYIDRYNQDSGEQKSAK